MIKLNKKQTKIIELIIFAISIILLIITIIGLEKAVKNKKTMQTSIDEQIETDLPTFETDLTEAGINIAEEIKNEASNKNQSKNKTRTKFTSPYYIKINYGANVVTVYTKNSEGEYTVPAKAMVCSTGTGTPRSGVYSLKSRWKWGKLFGDVYGYYCIQIVGNILFHSVPYLTKGDPSSLEYWEYDKLGTTASAGCIRLTVEDVKWIYNNVPSGTLVEFYSSSDPGPLRKTGCAKDFWK